MARRLMAGHRSLEPAVVVRIHPGQSVRAAVPVASRAPASVVALLVLGAVPSSLPGAAPWRAPPPAPQIVTSGSDTAAVLADADDVRGQARSAQARFERRRQRYLPRTFASLGGACDERVGRFCITSGEGEWIPEPEPDDVVALRDELLAELDSLQALAPDDGWILGQSVWYRIEGGDWSGALDVARACGASEPWWCAALEGLSLHGSERYPEAEVAFARALDGMTPERARAWRVPKRAVDADARRVIEDAEASGAPRSGADEDLLRETLALLWALADPLYLVEGNDRLTAHYARWTVATLKDGARNPYRMSWGRDLEELTVRHGWEIGWERATGSRPGAPPEIIGHKQSEGRDYMPSGAAFRAPAEAEAEEWDLARTRPRSLYTPPYAPVILPMGTADPEVVVFPRGERMLVVARLSLPDDTSFHADHEHPRPWMQPGDQARMPDRIGLFAVPLDRAGGAAPDRIGGSGDVAPPIFAARRDGSAEGTLLLDLPVGDYVVSGESWSPAGRLAGRFRVGVPARPAPPDVAALSDLLLVERQDAEPATVEDAAPHVLQGGVLLPGRRFGVAWEVAGLGFRQEVLAYELTVERLDRGIFRRLGALLGLGERLPALALSWEEASPEMPASHFRYLGLDLPGLGPGRYEVRIRLRTQGRSATTASAVFIIPEG